jgi:CRP-like cAMP-binding protein
MKTKMSSINLLQELNKPEFSDLLAELTPCSYQKNSLIYPSDDERDLVFIVKRGRVRIYLCMEDKEFSLAILEPGDIYTTHTRAHVAALDAVELLAMPTNKFHHYIMRYPELARTVTRILGEMLKQSFSIIDSLVFKDICQRLVDFFVYEAQHSGHVGEEGVTVRLNLTMEQLAAIVGSSRQTVSTIVNDMLAAGVLHKHKRGVFIIPNLNLLKNHCHP